MAKKGLAPISALPSLTSTSISPFRLIILHTLIVSTESSVEFLIIEMDTTQPESLSVDQESSAIAIDSNPEELLGRLLVLQTEMQTALGEMNDIAATSRQLPDRKRMGQHRALEGHIKETLNNIDKTCGAVRELARLSAEDFEKQEATAKAHNDAVSACEDTLSVRKDELDDRESKLGSAEASHRVLREELERERTLLDQQWGRLEFAREEIDRDEAAAASSHVAATSAHTAVALAQETVASARTEVEERRQEVDRRAQSIASQNEQLTLRREQQNQTDQTWRDRFEQTLKEWQKREGAAQNREQDAAHREQDAAQREQAVVQRENNAGQREEAAAQREHIVEQREHDAGQREHNAAQREHIVGQRESDAGQREHNAGLREDSAVQREHAAGQREGEALQRERAAHKREQDIMPRELKVAHREDLAQEHEQKNVQLERGLARREQDVVRREQAAETREHTVGQRERTVETLGQAVAQREEKAKQREKAVEARTGLLDEQESLHKTWGSKLLTSLQEYDPTFGTNVETLSDFLDQSGTMLVDIKKKEDTVAAEAQRLQDEAAQRPNLQTISDKADHLVKLFTELLNIQDPFAKHVAKAVLRSMQPMRNTLVSKAQELPRAVVDAVTPVIKDAVSAIAVPDLSDEIPAAPEELQSSLDDLKAAVEGIRARLTEEPSSRTLRRSSTVGPSLQPWKPTNRCHSPWKLNGSRRPWKLNGSRSPREGTSHGAILLHRGRSENGGLNLRESISILAKVFQWNRFSNSDS